MSQFPNRESDASWNKILSKAILQSPSTIIITDPQGKIEYVNRKFTSLTGYKFEEVKGKTPAILKSGHTTPDVYQQLWKTISMGEEWQGEFINKKKDGTLYYESAVISPVFDNNGVISRFLAIKEDVTQRVKAQHSIMRHSNRLAALLEASESFISMLDVATLSDDIIEKSIELSGMEGAGLYLFDDVSGAISLKSYRLEKNLSKSLLPLNVTIKDVPVMVQTIISRKLRHILNVEDVEVNKVLTESLIKSDVKQLLFLPLFVEGKTLGCVVLFSSNCEKKLDSEDLDACYTFACQASLTLNNAILHRQVSDSYREESLRNNELERLNNQLREARTKAEKSDSLKTAFLQNMSHEIRTPLNGILGFSELLKAKELSDDKRILYSSYVVDASLQLLGILDDLMDMSKLEAGEVVMNSERIDIGLFIESLYDMYRNRKAQSVKLLKSVSPLPKGKIFYGDRNRLKQVFDKLISNALKFTSQGEVEFGYDLAVDGSVEFFVSDTGIGVDPDKQELIFDPFYQADSGATRQYQGNGLGLTIASRIVEKMKSKIEVVSELGQGSKFSFNLQLKEGDDCKIIMRDNYHSSLNNDAYTVLIAEDDDVSYFLLYDLIENYNSTDRFKVIRARNGKEAVEHVTYRKDVDIILMDLKMPLMDGLTATRKIKDIDSSIPVIVQSAYALSSEYQSALEAGCDDFISKPVKFDQLFEKIYRYLHCVKN
ncbi:ATP-binding protein [Marinilabiliaceae bacterium ANBcel2]|nr:ATP-binding protein [Marinilabiliaceae bacterium ANBcel2]